MLSIIYKHKMIFLLFGITVIYILQFLVFPKCLPQYYPVSNEAWFIFIMPLVIYSVVMNILIDVNIAKWAITDIVYCAMIVVYNGKGFYGIGKRGIALDGMTPIYSLELVVITILLITLGLFIFQMLIRLIQKLILKIKKY